jgi:hypothetical protein
MRITLLATSLLFVLTACGAAPVVTTSEPATLNAGWSTRTPLNAGLTFGLPDSWTADAGVDSIRYTGDGLTLTVVRASAEESDLQAYLDKADVAAATGYEGSPSAKILKSEKTTIDGESAVVRSVDLLAAGMQARSAFALHKGTVYNVMFYRDDGSVPTATDEATFAAILKSVRWN